LPANDEREENRQRFLAGQLRAIVARTSVLLGVHHSFDDESEALFGIRPAPVDLAAAKEVRLRIARRLSGNKRLADRFDDFDSKFMIPPAKLPDVMARALEACRGQTLAHMRLPPGEHVTLEYVSDKPWSAYSFYRGNYQSVIQVNADFRLTVDRALGLACHEGYPGHHVFNSLTEERLVRRGKRIEFFAQPTFSPQSFISEAAASVAPELAFSAAEKLRLEEDVLFPAAGLPKNSLNNRLAADYIETEDLVDALHPEELSIARDYLDENLEFVRAAFALENRVLMTHSEATLRYLNEYRTYVVTYTAGRDLLDRWMDARAGGPGNSDARWAALRQLIETPESFRLAIN
jgi:hypothetical protein